MRSHKKTIFGQVFKILAEFNEVLIFNFAKECFVMWTHDCICKVFKILAKFNKVFNIEKFLIYV